MNVESYKSVLVANKDENIHKLIAGYLRNSGHYVDICNDISIAINMIEASDYDLVLVDIHESDEDELSFLVKIKEICPQLSVIVIIKDENIGFAIQALNHGASDLLIQPINLFALDITIERAIRRHKLVIKHMQEIEKIRRAYEESNAKIGKLNLELERVKARLRREPDGKEQEDPQDPISLN
jgi:DNA-binding NtrC family response regulator